MLAVDTGRSAQSLGELQVVLSRMVERREAMSASMNKQQLATRVWKLANNMRSKIEAYEYKDIILGLIFYKFLSDKEVAFLKSNDWEDEDIAELTEESIQDLEYIQDNLGYFIAYDDLYQTWIGKGSDFEYGDVTGALTRFECHISRRHQRVYSKIFDSLNAALPKLGDTDPNRVKAIRELLPVIEPIPTDSSQSYDVLGFVYEYLLKQFASNAGKKAGEFYTPHAVSRLKAEIIADHLKDQDTIDIFDGAAGSSSLLLNVGGAVARRNGNPNRIRYFAQEYKEATYHLTRMNLVMHGVNVGNIITRRGDTLDPEDWPTEAGGGIEPLRADAVTENPPYSQKWDAKDREGDPRFEYGVAPKDKADYAFLLHGLYHLKPSGIMTIILPHGVLFRGGDEEKIRTNLIENNHVDAIIGLPANIFYGTPISTLIMVLKKQRVNDDVIVIDASKGYVKVGKKNELRECDIKRIFDAYKNRVDVPGFAHVATKKEIQDNKYNLNIQRYVSGESGAEPIDVYASMFGGVPASEVNALSKYWEALPGLRESLFFGSGEYLESCENAEEVIKSHRSVAEYHEGFAMAFSGLSEEMREALIDGAASVHPVSDEDLFANNIMARTASVPLLDKYDAFQVLARHWSTIATDVEVIQHEPGGKMSAMRAVDERKVFKKNKDGKEEEVFDGYMGRIVPYPIVQGLFLSDQADEMQRLNSRLLSIPAELRSLIDLLPEEELEASYVSEDKTGFEAVELQNAMLENVVDEEDPEIQALMGYLELLDIRASKQEKLAYISSHSCVNWSMMEPNRDGTYGKGKVNARLKVLFEEFVFPPGSLGETLSRAISLINEEKALKRRLREAHAAIELDTKACIESLTEAQADQVLYMKWVQPVIDGLNAMPNSVICRLTDDVKHLHDKYAVTYAEVGRRIHETSTTLAEMLDMLDGNEFDVAGISEMRSILGGE